MLNYFPCIFFLGVILLVVFLLIQFNKDKLLSVLTVSFLMGTYLLTVIGITLFPIPIPSDINSINFNEQIPFVISHVNVVPFQYMGWFNIKVLIFEIGMNFLLTIPFGFLINFFYKINWKNAIWVSIASGLAFETSQFILSLFFGVYRTVDISDVILNTLGSFVGFFLYKILGLVISRHKYSNMPVGKYFQQDVR